MNSANTRYAVVLGLLTTLGPMAIDMYLPVLPAMGPALHAGSDALQASLMAFYLAMGAGQLIAGPLSDAYGRKPPLIAGLALFVLASIGCAFANDVQTLIALRLLQGLGACACMVTPRAMVRDLHTGPQAARMMALLMTVYTVSPILAPLAGSFIADAAGWRGVFWALATVGLVGLAMVLLILPETRPPAMRTRASLAQAWTGYGTLLRDGRFLVRALMASLTLGGFYVYVAGSPFVLGTHYGVSPRGYAILFGLNAVPYVAVVQVNGWLTRRFALKAIVRAAVGAQCAVAVALWAMFASGLDDLALLQVGLMGFFAFTGILLPSLFVLAMEGHAALAGSASALIGTLNFTGGAVAMAVVSPFLDGTPRPMLAGIAVCSVLVLALSRSSLVAATPTEAVT